MSNPQTSHLDINGLRLEVQHYAARDSHRPALLLLHEGLGCVAMWKQFPQQLADATGCPVIAYSRRGYGGSDGYPPPWPLSYMHDEALQILPRVLDALALTDVILVGHSDGASIALIHAGGHRDTRIRGVVLMAPHVFTEPVSIDSISQARDAYAQGDLRQRLQRYHGDNVDDAFLGWNGAWLDPGFLDWNLEPYLPAIEVPLLLIQGEDDQYGTRRQIDAIERQVSAPVTARLLPACRHAPHLDQPEATLREISQFITGIV